MTKVQKIWLGIFLAIAIVPEVLFQSTSRLVYEVFTLKNIIFGHRYVMVLVQSLSLLIAAFFVLVWKKSFSSKLWVYILSGFLFALALVAYLAYDTALHGVVNFRGF